MGEQHTACHTGPHGRRTWEQNEPEGAVGGRLCNNKRVWCLLVPAGGCDWLVWILSQAGRVVKPIGLRTRWGAAGPANRETSQAGRLSYCVGSGTYLMRAGDIMVRLLEP